MKIVVTDGYTLNGGDLSWAEIAQFGDLQLYDRSRPDEMEERCIDADIVLTNKAPMGRGLIDRLTRTKMIAVLATGFNIVDIGAAKAKGIVVCNVPAYGTASVAQHTIALLLELTNHVGIHSQSVALGDWSKSPDWSYARRPFTELHGKTMGIVGLGNIGQQTAQIATALGMNILYTDPAKKQSPLGSLTSATDLFATSDVVSLHCPLTPDNQQFVNRALLSTARRTMLLVNTSRGQLVQESHLAEALNEGLIGGAALDVLSAEPPDPANPLLKAKNCIITPHNAWMSVEARRRIMEVTAGNIRAFVAGKPVNVVST